jgi:hypothetical protein
MSDRAGSGAERTVIVRDEGPTAVMPQVASARPPGMARRLLPWLAVGAAAVAVIGGPTVWSAGLRSDAVPDVPVIASIPAAAPTTTTSAAPTTTPERTVARVAEELPTTTHRAVPPATTARPTTTLATPTTTTAVTTTSKGRNRFGSSASADPYGYFSDATDSAVAGY